MKAETGANPYRLHFTKPEFSLWAMPLVPGDGLQLGGLEVAEPRDDAFDDELGHKVTVE
jgi:hypothetical protein